MYLDEKNQFTPDVANSVTSTQFGWNLKEKITSERRTYLDVYYRAIKLNCHYFCSPARRWVKR